MTIRTRFAPSPTGFLHVGGIRTALFAYLVARQAGGQFILRIEDTDKKREVAGSVVHLITSLRTLGVQYDEGPDVCDDHNTYLQSDRLDIYRAWAEELIVAGRAYADPYTSAEVQAFRDQAKTAKRAFRYRDHRPENPLDWDGSTPLRFKSEPREYKYHDEVMGDITTSPEVIDDFILIKSDGYPTYNFAHIVDDTDMQITHVIRGQEFISSMPNYLNLYEALGFDMTARAEPLATSSAETSAARVSADDSSRETRRKAVSADDGGEKAGFVKRTLPKFAHLPHVMNETGNKKLGKRDGAKDVLEYVRDGYLPETLTSFIATLGWNDGTEQEVFTMDELIDKFSLARVQRSGARFDEKRLLWMNGQFIRRLSIDELASKVEYNWPEVALGASIAYKHQVLELVQDRLKTLVDLPILSSYFFAEPDPNPELISSNKQLKKLSSDEQIALVKAAHDALIDCENWNATAIQDALNHLLETTGSKPGILFSLIRITTTWAPFSPELDGTLELLGRERTLDRLASAQSVLQ